MDVDAGIGPSPRYANAKVTKTSGAAAAAVTSVVAASRTSSPTRATSGSRPAGRFRQPRRLGWQPGSQGASGGQGGWGGNSGSQGSGGQGSGSQSGSRATRVAGATPPSTTSPLQSRGVPPSQQRISRTQIIHPSNTPSLGRPGFIRWTPPAKRAPRWPARHSQAQEEGEPPAVARSRTSIHKTQCCCAVHPPTAARSAPAA